MHEILKMKVEDLSIPAKLNITEICTILYMLDSPQQRNLQIPISVYNDFEFRFKGLFNTDSYSENLLYYQIAINIKSLHINSNNRLELQENLILLLKELRLASQNLSSEIEELMREVIFKNPLNNQELGKAFEFHELFRVKGIFN